MDWDSIHQLITSPEGPKKKSSHFYFSFCMISATIAPTADDCCNDVMDPRTFFSIPFSILALLSRSPPVATQTRGKTVEVAAQPLQFVAARWLVVETGELYAVVEWIPAAM